MSEQTPKKFVIKPKAKPAAVEAEVVPEAQKVEAPAAPVATDAAVPKKVFKIKAKATAAPLPAPAPNPWWPIQTRIPITLGEEVDASLAEWYGTRGLPIPPEEVGIGAKIDAEEAARRTEEMRLLDLAARGVMEVEDAETGEKKQVVAPAGAKPEYGTPEFWAWARKRRAEKNAELAAKGLPPLPTAKEKEAAKAARAAARAAKNAGAK